jgi:hypothetical protein
MLEYIHDNFTVTVTDEDIAAPNRGNWWDNPVRRAVMRQFKLSYPIEVRIGEGYSDIFFPTETDKFDVGPYKRIYDFLDSFQHGWLVSPATFTFTLVKVIAKPPISTTSKVRRYSKDTETRLGQTKVTKSTKTLILEDVGEF